MCTNTVPPMSLLAATAIMTLPFLSGARVVAQESALGPPDVLEFPFEAAAEAPSGVPIGLLRGALEVGGDLALCQALMTAAGRPVPQVFTAADCEPSFADDVSNGEGIVHWADGARPRNCGDCVGRPFMTGTQFVNQPNLRQAKLYGQLTFVADPPGPFNRDITYGFEATFTCNAEDGAHSADFVLRVKFGEPVIGDPGLIESVLDFLLLPADLSTRIEREIDQQLASVGERAQSFRRCRSVGVFREDPAFDAAVFDPANASQPRFGALFASTSALSDRATIRFHRLTRKPLPANVDAGHASPGNPAAGYFSVFLNGKLVAFPALSPNPSGGIPLPPEGGAVDLNFCKTIDLTDHGRLQVIFTNDLGGAAWSQFLRADGFGGASPHTITTGRTIVVPGSPGLPDPRTGFATPAKPHAIVLEEFELSYGISFVPRPGTVVATEPPARPDGPGDVGPLDVAIGDRAIVAVDPSISESTPCREI